MSKPTSEMVAKITAAFDCVVLDLTEFRAGMDRVDLQLKLAGAALSRTKTLSTALVPVDQSG